MGKDFLVIEDGLNGRTTMFDDIVAAKPYRNGLQQLLISLETHYPIDLVIIFLGTNDVKKQYQKSIADIALGLKKLIQLIKCSGKGPDGSSPKILVIAPQPLIESGLSELFNKESIQKSLDLAREFEKIANAEECDFLDAGRVVVSCNIDGLHLEKDQIKLLAQVIVEKVQEIFIV